MVELVARQHGRRRDEMQSLLEGLVDHAVLHHDRRVGLDQHADVAVVDVARADQKRLALIAGMQISTDFALGDVVVEELVADCCCYWIIVVVVI